MFQKFIEICKLRDLKKIWLTCNRHNTKTIAVYEHLGFQKVNEEVTDIGNGFVMDDYIFEYEVKSEAGDLLTYELITGGETVQEGFLDLGDDDLLFDDLTPDTRYSVKIFKNSELLDTIHFRTKPADGNPSPEYTAPVPTGTTTESSSDSTSEPTAESTIETTEEPTEMTTEETTEET
jgi:hypothetical protein